MSLLRQVFGRTQSPPLPVVDEIWIDGIAVTLTFRRHAAARRFTLRMARQGDAFVMTLPKRASLAEARRFAIKSESWMRAALTKAARRIDVVDGAVITVRGIDHTVVATGTLRGRVLQDREAGLLHVPGAPEHMARRLLDWLKAEARNDLEQASRFYAEAMETRFRRLSVRDQKSRWGSCSAEGELSYSWRLILAPPMVLDYVAAHEVAHLQEMNHGPRFWRLVLRHCPHTRAAKTWLKTHGNRLHALAV